jgi:hypothetical protein
MRVRLRLRNSYVKHLVGECWSVNHPMGGGVLLN